MNCTASALFSLQQLSLLFSFIHGKKFWQVINEKKSRLLTKIPRNQTTPKNPDLVEKTSCGNTGFGVQVVETETTNWNWCFSGAPTLSRRRYIIYGQRIRILSQILDHFLGFFTPSIQDVEVTDEKALLVFSYSLTPLVSHPISSDALYCQIELIVIDVHSLSCIKLVQGRNLPCARIRSCPHWRQPMAALSLIVNINEKMDSERLVEVVRARHILYQGCRQEGGGMESSYCRTGSDRQMQFYYSLN